LCDEYHAGHRARDHARKLQSEDIAEDLLDEEAEVQDSDPTPSSQEARPISVKSQRRQEQNKFELEDEDGFPLEGGSESQIECLTCGFKPKPTKTTFCSLTLSVPQVSSTTLNACFDGMFKTEYIEDFKCEKCRLVHALETFQQELVKSTSEKFKRKTEIAVEKLKLAIETNPEEEPKDVELPDKKFAPKRKIAKHVQVTKFPKVMAIHLSRSIFDVGMSTMKNSAKVSFPERLPLGGLLNQRKYKLLSVVCHKGSHNSGHYESFRRQNIYPPFSTPNTFHPSLVYSKPPTPTASYASTPQIGASETTGRGSVTPETLSPASASAASSNSLPYTNGRYSLDASSNGRPYSITTATSISTGITAKPGPTSAPRDSDTGSVRSIARSAKETLSKIQSPLGRSTSTSLNSFSRDTTRTDATRSKRKKKSSDRWWRISDEKIKECKTSDVLGMQREVYMLFYELEKGDDDP